VTRAVVVAVVAAAIGLAACGKGKERRVRRDRDAGVKVGRADPVVGGRVSAGDEKEPNDTAADATPVRPGTYVRGTLDGETDVDVYAVEVDSGQLRATVSGIEGVDLVLELRDAQGAVLARSDRGPALTVEGIAGYGVSKGTYFLAVSEFVKPRKKPKPPKPAKGKKAAPVVDSGVDPQARLGPSPAYELTVEHAPAPADLHEAEPNDDTGTAAEVLLADAVRGWIGWSGDVDLWKLSLQDVGADYCLDVDVGGVDGLTLTVDLLDAGGARLLSRKGAKGGGIQLRCLVPVLPEGAPPWHFVKIVADRSNPEATYELGFKARLREDDEEAEPNDTAEQATPLIGDGGPGGVVRATYTLGDVDRFRIDGQDEPSLLDVTVEPPPGVDVELEIGAAGAKPLAVARAAGPGGKERLTGVAIPAGMAVVVSVRAKPGKADTGEARPYRVVWSIAPAAGDPMPREEEAVDPGAGEYE
jgi:hypothetical protein